MGGGFFIPRAFTPPTICREGLSGCAVGLASGVVGHDAVVVLDAHLGSDVQAEEDAEQGRQHPEGDGDPERAPAEQVS